MQNFILILEWGQGTCSLTKHTRCWAYFRYFFHACCLFRFAAFFNFSTRRQHIVQRNLNIQKRSWYWYECYCFFLFLCYKVYQIIVTHHEIYEHIYKYILSYLRHSNHYNTVSTSSSEVPAQLVVPSVPPPSIPFLQFHFLFQPHSAHR